MYLHLFQVAYMVGGLSLQFTANYIGMQYKLLLSLIQTIHLPPSLSLSHRSPLWDARSVFR